MIIKNLYKTLLFCLLAGLTAAFISSCAGSGRPSYTKRTLPERFEPYQSDVRSSGENPGTGDLTDTPVPDTDSTSSPPVTASTENGTSAPTGTEPGAPDTSAPVTEPGTGATASGTPITGTEKPQTATTTTTEKPQTSATTTTEKPQTTATTTAKPQTSATTLTTKAPVTMNEPEPPTPYAQNGDFSDRFGDLFLEEGKVEKSGTLYRSHDIYIRLTSHKEKVTQITSYGGKTTKDYTVSYYVYDIYIRNIENFRSSYSNKGTKKITDLAGGTVLALTGDTYLNSEFPKYVVRNGELLKEPKEGTTHDICVLYRNGVMRTYSAGEYDWKTIKERDPWQVWTFGPGLLDKTGEVRSDIGKWVWNFNPRAAMGYIEPGHYVFVAVDGRSKNGSAGMNLDALAELMHRLGCVSAFNFDGGNSAQTVFNGSWSYQSSNYRNIYDAVCIGEIS